MSPAATSVSRRRWARPSRSTVRRAEATMRRAGVDAPPQGLEHGLAAERHRLDRRRAAVMRSTRTTSRQRPLARVTGLGPHSGGRRAPRRGSRRPAAGRRTRGAADRAASSACSAAPIWPSRSSARAWT